MGLPPPPSTPIIIQLMCRPSATVSLMSCVSYNNIKIVTADYNYLKIQFVLRIKYYLLLYYCVCILLQWELGIPLHGIVLNLQSGLMQHYLYVLLGKAKYLDSLGVCCVVGYSSQVIEQSQINFTTEDQIPSFVFWF